VADLTETAPQTEQIKTKKQRVGWLEKRRIRRRKRVMFEEIMGWILVPFLLYFLYLGYKAMGGMPPAVKDFLNELLGLAMRGGK
jgi:hypothetical protein